MSDLKPADKHKTKGQRFGSWHCLLLFFLLRGIKLLISLSLNPLSYLYIWISYSLDTIKNDVIVLQYIQPGLLTLTNNTVFEISLKTHSRTRHEKKKKRENIEEVFEAYDDIKESPRARNVATHSRILLSIISF